MVGDGTRTASGLKTDKSHPSSPNLKIVATTPEAPPPRPMSDRIYELLDRNLQEVFGEVNAARRRAAIEELYTDDCVLDGPTGVFVGQDALDKFAGDLRATHPHFVYTPHRLCITLAVWRGDPARAERSHITLAWM